MNASVFDPELFLQQGTTEQSVRRPPVPAGTEVVGTITDLKVRQWQGKKDPTQSGIAFDVQIKCETSTLADQPETVTFKDGIMVDTTPHGTIDYGTGKNNRLRQYRDATGQNVAGQMFRPVDLIGRMVKVKVAHRVNDQTNEIYDEVGAIAKA